jgi:hypothetical protein
MAMMPSGKLPSRSAMMNHSAVPNLGYQPIAPTSDGKVDPNRIGTVLDNLRNKGAFNKIPRHAFMQPEPMPMQIPHPEPPTLEQDPPEIFEQELSPDPLPGPVSPL